MSTTWPSNQEALIRVPIGTDWTPLLRAIGRRKAAAIRAAERDSGLPWRQATCRHSFVFTGSAYGGDDDRWHGEGRSYCQFCGLDGDG